MMWNELFNYVENQNTKIAKKVYDYMNGDNISIITDGEVFWLEYTNESFGCAKYPSKAVFDYIKRFMNKKGYIYLYDIKEMPF